MAEARASHLRLVVNEPAAVTVRQPKLRFRPGGAAGGRRGLRHACRDRHRVRGHVPAAPSHGRATPSAAGWLGDLIERAARLAAGHRHPHAPHLGDSADGRSGRPGRPDGGRSRRDARSACCPRKIRIDFCDSSVIALEDLALDRIDAFRRRGFRIGLDARKSWRTPMGARARMTFEAVRLDPPYGNPGHPDVPP